MICAAGAATAPRAPRLESPLPVVLPLIGKEFRVLVNAGFKLFAALPGGSTALTPCKGDFMANGIVKWFNPTKGFGFIQPEQGGSDVFVHISALERAGIGNLNEGQRVSYELA